MDPQLHCCYAPPLLLGLWACGLFCDLRSTFAPPRTRPALRESNPVLRYVCARYGVRRGVVLQVLAEACAVLLLPVLLQRGAYVDPASVGVVAAVIGVVHLDCCASNRSLVLGARGRR